MACSDSLLKLYRATSYITSSPVYATIIGWYILWFRNALNMFNALAVLAFLGIGPVIIILLRKLREGFKDVFLSRRDERFAYFTYAVASYALGSLFFLVMREGLMASYAFTYAAVTTSIALATLKVKASVHVAGIAGPTTFLTLALGLPYAALYGLLGPVAIARYCLRAHSIKELLIGGALAIASAFIAWLWLSSLNLTSCRGNA